MNFKKNALIFIGTVMLAISSAVFFLPNKILSGGVSGVALIIVKFISLPADIVASALTVILLLVSLFFLGKEFTLSTVFSSIVFAILLPLFSRVIDPIIMDPLLACIYGGIIGGIGIGIVFRQGASTGGMDIPAMILNKYFKIKLSTSVMIIDTLTVAMSLLLYPLPNVLVGLLSVYVTSFGIDKAMEFGTSKVKEVKVISDKYETIKNIILEKLNRGVTLYYAQGGYEGQQRKVLMCVIGEDQYSTLLEIIEKTDPSAFVVVSDVNDVHGEGFTYFGRI